MSKTLNIKDIQDKINANTVLTNEEEQYIEKFMLVEGGRKFRTRGRRRQRSRTRRIQRSRGRSRGRGRSRERGRQRES